VTLLQKQQLFGFLLQQLIGWIYANGWAVTLGEGYRSDGQGHMPGSLHYERLAQDLNLFVGNDWKETDCPEWQAIGTAWKSFNPLCRWGGDFQEIDLNHFSLEHNGRA